MSTTTITDSLRAPAGGLFVGTMNVYSRGADYLPQGMTLISGPTTITAGVLSVSLTPNDETAAGNDRYVAYFVGSDGVAWSEEWVVPISAVAVPLAIVRVSVARITPPLAYEQVGAACLASLIAAGPVLAAAVSVSSAELLALFTTPKVIVAAPAAGSYHELLAASIIYDAGGTAYTIGTAGSMQFAYRPDGSGDALTVALAATGFLDSATDLVRAVKLITTNVEPVVGANGSIVLKIATASPTLGDGTLRVKVLYRTIASGL